MSKVYEYSEAEINLPRKWVCAEHPSANRREAYFCTFCWFSLYFSPLFPGSSRAATHSCQLPSMWCPSMPCAGDATHTIHLPWRMEPTSRVRQQAQPPRPGSCRLSSSALGEGVQTPILLPFQVSTLPFKWACSFVSNQMPRASHA